LNYNINQALNPELWNGEFHAVLLYRSIKHLASDIKNIKEFLYRMGNYIKDKFVNNNPNDVKDLDSVGKVVWKFLSIVYNAHWNSLYMDNFKILFRNKVKSKFNPQASRTPVNNKGKETVKPTYIFTLPPSIPAKTSKEVNKILKYFKKNDNPQKKSYAQASSNPRAPMPP